MILIFTGGLLPVRQDSPGAAGQEAAPLFTRAAAGHIFFQTSLPLAEGAGKFRAEQFRVQRIQVRPYFQQDKACFIRIAAASPLADHVFPLIRRGADYQHIAEALRGKVPRGVPEIPQAPISA